MRRGVERQKRLKAEQRFCCAGHRHQQTGNERQADQAAEIADGPSGSRQAAKLGFRHEPGHDGIRENAHKFGRQCRGDEACQHQQDCRQRRVRLPSQSVLRPARKTSDEQRHPGFTCAATIGGRTEKGAEDGDQKPRHGSRVAPQRLSARGFLAALRYERAANRILTMVFAKYGANRKVCTSV